MCYIWITLLFLLLSVQLNLFTSIRFVWWKYYTMVCKLGISSKIHIVCSKDDMIYPVPGIGI